MSEQKKCCGNCTKTEREKELEKLLKNVLKCRQLSHAKAIIREAGI